MEELKQVLAALHKKEKVMSILIGAAVIVLVVLIISLFYIFRGRDEVSMQYQKELERLEKERASIVRERTAWNAVIDQQEETIIMLRQRDSLLVENIKQTNLQIKQLDNETNKISNRIRTYGSPELKRAFSEFR